MLEVFYPFGCVGLMPFSSPSPQFAGTSLSEHTVANPFSSGNRRLGTQFAVRENLQQATVDFAILLFSFSSGDSGGRPERHEHVSDSCLTAWVYPSVLSSPPTVDRLAPYCHPLLLWGVVDGPAFMAASSSTGYDSRPNLFPYRDSDYNWSRSPAKALRESSPGISFVHFGITGRVFLGYFLLASSYVFLMLPLLLVG